MPLKPKPPGTNITGAFSAGIAQTPELGEEFLPKNSYHLPAFAVSLKDLSNVHDAKSLEDLAKEVAWQCLAASASDPTERALIGEVTPLDNAPRPAGHVFDGPVRMTSVSYGEIINGAYKSAQVLNEQQVQLFQKFNLDGDYEPRMLRIPGLLITAIWLKSQTPAGQDWIIPLHTKIPALKVPNKEMFALEEFLTITKPLADQRLTTKVFD
jgi:hypothetical protein